MNARMHIDVRMVPAGLLLAACTASLPGLAAGPPTLPPVQAVLDVVDCAERTPPLQREVAEWTGQHNLGQAFATRQRLMADVARACRGPAVARVMLVLDPRAGAGSVDAAVAVVPRGG